MGNKRATKIGSWGAVLGAIVTAVGVYFGLPEYVFEIRPHLEKFMGTCATCFVEGLILSAITVIIVLRLFIGQYEGKEDIQERAIKIYTPLCLDIKGNLDQLNKSEPILIRTKIWEEKNTEYLFLSAKGKTPKLLEEF